jgi:hypothetical protein
MDGPAEPAGVPSDPEWALDFSITGRSVPMTARAEVKVVEGRNAVHVAITSRTSGTDDLMTIDLTFDGIENALGPHEVQFSLPEGGEHIAIGSLDGTWYYSQGGSIELSVNPEGSIEGSFEIALARGEVMPVLPIVFAPDEEATPLVGQFRGQWVLNCLSRLAGHQSLISGGDYCDSLEF